MTVLRSPEVASRPACPGVERSPDGPEAPKLDAAPEGYGPDLDGDPPGLMLASSALTILAVLLLGFVVQLVLISPLQHWRAQRVEYSHLRFDLAQGTAPVSALDANGKPLPTGTPVAVISIPSIGVREVVGQGTSASVLAKGPGHLRSTVMPGQTGLSVIMGRRAAYGGPFARLNSLQVGAKIDVTTGQGEQHFEVLDVRRAGDPAPAPIGSNEGRLMLITATGAAFVPSGVLRVDAKLVSQVQPAGVAAGQTPSDENVLRGEPDSWLGIVLWGQAFLLAALGFVWARARWGRWQAWVIGIPTLAALGLTLADSIIHLLPNVM